MNQDNYFTLNRGNVKNIVKIDHFWFFFWPFGRLLRSKWTHWHESLKILSSIFWHKFRVGTRGWLASNGPYSIKNGSKRPKNGPILTFSHFNIIYMAHRKVNSPKHLKDGEIFFWDTPSKSHKNAFLCHFFYIFLLIMMWKLQKKYRFHF